MLCEVLETIQKGILGDEAFRGPDVAICPREEGGGGHPDLSIL